MDLDYKKIQKYASVTILVFASAILLFYSILNLSIHNTVVSIVELFLSFFLLLCLIFFRADKYHRLVTIFTLVVICGIFTYLYYSGGYNKTGIFWVFYFPLLAIFMSGKKIGIIFSIVQFIVLLVIYALSLLNVIKIPYDSITAGIFLVIYVISVVLIGIIEHFRTDAENRLKQNYQEIRDLNCQLETLASFDYLTEVYNRRLVIELLEKQLAFYTRYERSFSILIMDLDHFKLINDYNGHIFGDKVLKRVSQIMTNMLRLTDTLGRYGGEEFLIILPETDITGAYILAERLRIKIAEEAFFNEESDQVVPVTVSIGIYCVDKICDINEALRNADKALYDAKEKGRNRVEIHHEF